MAVPNSLNIPTSAPADLNAMGMYLTQLAIALQNWITQAATAINGLGNYSFSNDSSGNLIAINNSTGAKTVLVSK